MSSGKGLATRTQENVMKAIVSALVALSVLTGVAVAPAAATTDWNAFVPEV